jgi:hypothetical protein
MAASQRLQDLGAIVEELREANDGMQVKMYFSRRDVEANSGAQPTLDWGDLNRMNQGQVETVASEVIQHLRIALDYLAYQLAWLDSGLQQQRTQFPIVDQSAQWSSRCRQDLPGVHRAHLDLIRQYQPFAGCSWTRELRDLSNTDKHRFVVDVSTNFSGTFTYDLSELAPDPSDPERLVLGFPARVTIGLADGRELLEVLRPLAVGVSEVLLEFQGYFGEQDELRVASGVK